MALLCVIIIVLMSTTCSLNKKLTIAKNNIEAVHDSLHTFQMENGELVKYKKAYILKSKDYSEYMNISNKRIRELEDKLDSKISEIAILESTIDRRDLQMTDSIVKRDDTTDVLFYYHDKWNEIGGTTSFYKDEAQTTIDSIKTNVPLIVGITEENKIFATSENPNVRFTSIDGAIESTNKKTHKSIGFKVVIGPTIGYDVLTNRSYIGIGITAGFGWGYGINY